MDKKINQIALGLAGATLGAIGMLLIGIIGNFGFCKNIVEMMSQWHMYFSLSITGIIAGMVEAAVISFVALYVLAWFYNKFNKNG